MCVKPHTVGPKLTKLDIVVGCSILLDIIPLKSEGCWIQVAYPISKNMPAVANRLSGCIPELLKDGQREHQPAWSSSPKNVGLSGVFHVHLGFSLRSGAAQEFRVINHVQPTSGIRTNPLPDSIRPTPHGEEGPKPRP